MDFDNMGRLANFSDIFRYKMVDKFDLGWVDADTICLTDTWFAEDEYYCIQQHNGEIQAGVFRLPSSSEILSYIIKESSSIDRSKSGWNDTNSKVFKKAFDMFPHYKKFLIDEKWVNGIEYTKWYKLWKPEFFNEMMDLSQNIKSFSIYNEMVGRAKMDKNLLPEGSAISFFYNKYVLDKK